MSIKEKKIKKKKASKSKVKKAYDFTVPHEYHKSIFGRASEEVCAYTLNIDVEGLLQDFKVFEDLNNVQNWPISTLIQRELDHKRASLICKDYLLRVSDTKYFPPLIAVLIPTDIDYKPLGRFGDIDSCEVDAITTKFVKGEPAYDNFETPIGVAGGVSVIPFSDDEGDIIWDKTVVSAVIIDGQHRYKALQEAKQADKSFSECKVSITLVDLKEMCDKTQLAPTDVARDLFVTINNTPIEVDETRLVLMDDKDVLSTFTQVLIDDSLGDELPSIPPMLIDWDCEGAKNNSSNSLSGVLVLRQIVLSAIFDESRVSTVEDRTNVRNVRKWKEKIEDWMSPNELITAELSQEETIDHRFKIAIEQLEGDADDDEEESIFLFSYGSSVSKLLKKRFQSLFLSSFRAVFSDLAPYRRIHEVAKKHGVLTTDKPLNNYYRAFKGKRATLKKDAETSKAVSIYEKEFTLITEKSIPFTVMGQKAIFKSLFDGFLSNAEKRSEEVYVKLTNEFLEGFEQIYSALCPSINSDENFFLTDYKMKKNKVAKAKSVGSEFWKGIIIKYNGEIDYSKSAISILSQIIQDAIFFYCEEDELDERKVFLFKDYTKLISRHERLIKKLEYEKDLDAEEIRDLAEKVVIAKQKELHRLLSL